MSRHDDAVRLQHMLDHAREAIEMTKGRKRVDLDGDRMLQLAILRLVEIVGESASRVSETGQALYMTIPWSQIIGMRNKLVHGYDEADLNILWDTVMDDLPPTIYKN